MTDEIWTRDEIESPCRKICLIHPEAKICVGCHRTREEIATWSRITPEQRAAIMAELPGRESILSRRPRRGRAGRRAV